jgi:CheY-like chemotaxis protein
LSLVHGIVTDVGGAIDVTSTVGTGSIFTVYLPRCGDAGQKEGGVAATLPRGSGQCILIVDDEGPLARLAAEILSDLGYVPVCFHSSLMALETFRRDPGRFDVVLTDERMPGMSGSALIAAIRKVCPDIPVLLMTGYLGDATIRKLPEETADAILRKPLSARDLANGLAQVLERHNLI